MDSPSSADPVSADPSPTTQRSSLAPTNPSEAPTQPGTKRERQITAALELWTRHRERLRQIVGPLWADAVARRLASAPDLRAVADFYHTQKQSFEEDHDFIQKSTAAIKAMGESTGTHRENVQKLWNLEMLLQTAVALSDTTTVTNGQSVGGLLRQSLGYRGTFDTTCDRWQEVEASVFGNSDAKSLEAITPKDGKELAARLQASIPRYQAAVDEILPSTGLDADLQAAIPMLFQRYAFSEYSEYYARHWNEKLVALHDEYTQTRTAIRTALGTSTEDTPESRRMLTALAELDSQLQDNLARSYTP